MTDINNTFFELIQVAIGTRICLSHTPSEDEWGELYAMAKKQSLVGVCFAAVHKLCNSETSDYCGMNEMLYLIWMGMAAKIQQRNEVVSRQCVDLQKRLSSDGWRSCILKGQGNHLNYGTLATLRQSGDIDIWLDGQMEDIIRYVNGISPFEKINQQHLDLNMFDDTEVEVHFTPSRFANRIVNRRLQAWFGEVRKAQMSNVQSFGSYGVITVPTNEFNIVYQLLHIYRHLFNEGIGLRQLMDYYFVLKVDLDVEGKNKVRRIVSDFGMSKFASALMWVLQKVFGLRMTGVPWTPNQRDGEFLLEEIMLMGNFGHSDDRYRLKKDDSHAMHFWQSTRSKLRFIGHFPSEVLCQPIDMFLRFFEVRALRKKASGLKYND